MSKGKKEQKIEDKKSSKNEINVWIKELSERKHLLQEICEILIINRANFNEKVRLFMTFPTEITHDAKMHIRCFGREPEYTPTKAMEIAMSTGVTKGHSLPKRIAKFFETREMVADEKEAEEKEMAKIKAVFEEAGDSEIDDDPIENE